jgi:hypothetical protein
MYAPDRYPDIPPRADITPFRCFAVSPTIMTDLYLTQPPRRAQEAEGEAPAQSSTGAEKGQTPGAEKAQTPGTEKAQTPPQK